MKIKNLERATEIYDELGKLEAARSILSGEVAFVVVRKESDGSAVVLPRSIRHNMLMMLNVQINKLREEVDGL